VSAAAAGVANSAAQSAKVAASRVARTGKPVTLSLIALNVVIWVWQLLNPDLTNQLVYWPGYTISQPWRMVTSGFAHDPSSPLHILFNMYSLFVLGTVLEPMLGKSRFFALYMFSMVAGSFGYLLLGDFAADVLGASGAIFGLMGAYFVILRTYGAQLGQIGGIIAINLVYGFIVSGVAWQAHVGGLLGGALIAFIYSKTRMLNQRSLQTMLVVACFAALVIASYVVGNDKINSFFGL